MSFSERLSKRVLSLGYESSSRVKYGAKLMVEGLTVSTAGQCLGKVDHLLETGANDVLVVKPCEGSIDSRERLIPWVQGQYVKQVDLIAATIEVDWDPEF